MEVVITVVTLIANWYIFKKIGREGWEGIIPFYNIYILFEEIEGNGLIALWLLVPIINIYWIFRINIDLARSFNKSTGFGIGLTLLDPIFSCILAFSDAYYLDGSYENMNEDFLTNLAGNISNNSKKKEDVTDSLEAIERLADLYKDGIITKEEFEEKKKDILDRI